ncbi:hypothetical protein AMTRI_Chr11g99960 [Amborella trichopoda]|uniref:Uncharacterized protein n=1 Tax=Amborella trichopoda TaxID=13333 RepID=W1PAN1_AMBTC|nr:scarecrow-like protein 1 [Amborella trichopoda]XP_011622871.1 scarecrow-like protein 1 [Amborella trichopoda]XP_011622872.1 scarecrow-like protein 1 [Amborella trichopoda]XP_020522081.1 scarecrow-like protein 1 [Amborella trichopoda]ERN04724.1 hypothetical protein AMTR_s00186p00018500 [Amborella trichopoda]|eukprot:XP_006843049.1 scarecrow-like protein 1 [Amborella trichopoda]
MSLLRSTDPSSTLYGDPNLYALQSSTRAQGLPTRSFSLDRINLKYLPDFYGEVHNQLPFSDSPLEEFISQQVDFFPPTPTGSSPYHLISSLGPSANSQESCNMASIAQSHTSSLYDSSHHGYAYESMDEHGRTMYDDAEEMRRKLQELEMELLDDSDECVYDGHDMPIDMIESLLPNSPKEPSDSNLTSTSTTTTTTSNSTSSTSTNRDSPTSNIISPCLSSTTSLTPKQILFGCATAISEGNLGGATTMVNELRQMVSVQGDPPQRIAAYMVEGLAARMASSGQGLYKALRCKEPPSLDRLSAMQILFEVCPCFKFGFVAANGTITEAIKDEERVHIIDFDINQGSQYITLIQALASRPGRRPHLCLTGVDDPESVQRSVGGLMIIGQRLEKLAEALGLPFEFRAVASKTKDVRPSMLACRPDEALIVNFAFQLHHMPDESVSTVNERDRLLRMVRGLGPKLVTFVEQDVNTNTSPFLARFAEAYEYYLAVFESLDLTLARESTDRMNVERHCLARDIVNIVACEGADRIERYETAGKWRVRMTMAGFSPSPLGSQVKSAIGSLLRSYCNRYTVKEEAGALYFGWEDKTLVTASAWH